MAIVQTGSILTFTGLGTANTGTVSTTITVPADAQFVVVGWSGFSTTANFFSGGSMTFTKGGADTAMTMVAGSDTSNWSGAMAYLALPDTGSNKTLKWDWLGAGTSSDPSTMCCVTFWKGIDTASPVRGTGFGSAGTQPYTTGTITAASGDLFIAWCPFFSSLEDTINTWTGLSTLAQQTLSGNADAAWATGSPSGNAAVAALTRTIGGDGALFCISAKASSGTVEVEGQKSKTIFIPGARGRGPTKGLSPTQAFAPAIILPDFQVGRPKGTIFIPGDGPTRGLSQTKAFAPDLAVTSSAVGAAAGIGAATAVGAATAASVGSAAGVGSATAVGQATAASVGSAAGIGSATAIGASTAAAVGSAAGIGAASGPDVSTAASVGTSAGIGAATGIGASTAAAVGSAAGTGSASAISQSQLEPQTGFSQGFLFHPGRGPSWDIIKRSAYPADIIGGSFGTAAGVGAATAVGASTAASVGTAAGTGAATAPDASTAASVGSAAGIGAATAVGAATGAAVGSATGIGAGAAVGASTAVAVGSASGVGAATGAGASLGTAAGDGLAPGVGVAAAVGASIAAAVGIAIGFGAAAAVSGGTDVESGRGYQYGWKPWRLKKKPEEELEELEAFLKAAAEVAPPLVPYKPIIYQGPLAAIFDEPIEPRTTPTVNEIMAKARAEAQLREYDDEEALLLLFG